MKSPRAFLTFRYPGICWMRALLAKVARGPGTQTCHISDVSLRGIVGVGAYSAICLRRDRGFCRAGRNLQRDVLYRCSRRSILANLARGPRPRILGFQNAARNPEACKTVAALKATRAAANANANDWCTGPQRYVPDHPAYVDRSAALRGLLRGSGGDAKPQRRAQCAHHPQYSIPTSR